MSNIVRKEDRRIARTRALLRDALLSLIVEMGYQGISIQDITDRANVARTTFYLHYQDKDDLLFKSMKEMYENLIARIPKPSLADLQQGKMNLGNASDFEHVREFANFYRIMLGEQGSPVFMSRVRQLLAEAFEQEFLTPLVPNGKQPRVPLSLLGYMMAGMQIGTMSWWVNRGLTPDPDIVAQMSETVSIKGILWGLSIID